MASRIKLKVSTFTSAAEVRESTKKADGGDIWSVPKEGCTVRFIADPEEWIGYWEAYIEDSGYLPVAEGDDLPAKARQSFRYLANVLWQSEGSRQGKVTAFKMPKTVAISLMNKFDKYGTLCDRDYEIIRIGEGVNTEYDVTPEDKSKVSLVAARKDAFDLVDVLMGERERVLSKGSTNGDAADDDDEDEAAAKPAAKKPAAKTPAKKAAPKPEPEPEVEDSWAETGEAADEGDDDAQAALTIAAEGADIDPDDYPTWGELASVLDSLSDADEEEDEEEEDEEDESDDDEEEADDEEEDEDEEEIEIDEDTLNAMSIAALKELADEYGVDIDGLKTKKSIVAAIIESAEE